MFKVGQDRVLFTDKQWQKIQHDLIKNKLE